MNKVFLYSVGIFELFLNFFSFVPISSLSFFFWPLLLQNRQAQLKSARMNIWGCYSTMIKSRPLLNAVKGLLKLVTHFPKNDFKTAGWITITYQIHLELFNIFCPELFSSKEKLTYFEQFLMSLCTALHLKRSIYAVC